MKSSFLVLRFFLLPTGLLATSVPDRSKIELFTESFFQNSNFTIDATAMIMRAVEHRDGIVSGKLARSKSTEIHTPTSDDIEPAHLESWPPAHFIVSLKEQVMVLEVKAAWGMSRKRICEVLSERGTNLLLRYGYEVQFDTIVPADRFWDLINNAEGVYTIAFKLNSPNLFGASKALNQELAHYRDIFNNTTTEMRLNNEAGQLKTPHDELERLRSYADDGGGEWDLVLKQGGKRVRRNSQRSAVTVKISYDGEVPVAVLDSVLRLALGEIAKNRSE